MVCSRFRATSFEFVGSVVSVVGSCVSPAGLPAFLVQVRVTSLLRYHRSVLPVGAVVPVFVVGHHSAGTLRCLGTGAVVSFSGLFRQVVPAGASFSCSFPVLCLHCSSLFVRVPAAGSCDQRPEPSLFG